MFGKVVNELVCCSVGWSVCSLSSQLANQSVHLHGAPLKRAYPGDAMQQGIAVHAVLRRAVCAVKPTLPTPTTSKPSDLHSLRYSFTCRCVGNGVINLA